MQGVDVGGNNQQLSTLLISAPLRGRMRVWRCLNDGRGETAPSIQINKIMSPIQVYRTCNVDHLVMKNERCLAFIKTRGSTL